MFYIIILFLFVLHVGGAIEITLTRESQSGEGTQSKLEHILGYISLFGNTVCMVSYTATCVKVIGIFIYSIGYICYFTKTIYF